MYSLIRINQIAASPMTETVMPPEMLKSLSPEFIVPLVAVLCHPDGPDASGKVFELGAGFMAEIRWERTKGAVFKPDESFTPSAIKERWAEISDFTNPDHPRALADTNVVVRLHEFTSNIHTEAFIVGYSAEGRQDEQCQAFIRRPI